METLSPEFKAQMLWCTRCKLHKTRTNVVIGEGPENAAVMLIGEAPGQTEDVEGRPFCGKSGTLLREKLNEIGLLDKSYITNIVKCRPPNNRDPEEDEVQACLPYLKGQIQLIDPDIIIGVGRISSTRIVPHFLIKRDHGKIFTLKNGKKFIGIYHPAAALRNPRIKTIFEEDFKKIKNIVDQ